MWHAPLTALLAGLLAGCSMFGDRERAPQGFRDTACSAFESLTHAQAAIGLGKLDLIVGFIADGRRFLAVVPAWEPGTSFVDRMRDVSDVIDAADASMALELVNAEYRELYDRNGFTCDWVFRPLPSPLWPAPTSTPPAG